MKDRTPETPYPVVAFLATDWSHYGPERHVAEDLTLMDGWTVGLLIKEDDEKLVIAHQFFTEEKAIRNTSVISKITVKERIELGRGGDNHANGP